MIALFCEKVYKIVIVYSTSNNSLHVPVAYIITRVGLLIVQNNIQIVILSCKYTLTIGL